MVFGSRSLKDGLLRPPGLGGLVITRSFKSAFWVDLEIPQGGSIKGPMASIRWYLGCLNGYLGGAGT